MVLPGVAVQRDRLAAGADLRGAAVEQPVGRTQRVDDAAAARDVVQGGGELVGRLERHLRQPGDRLDVGARLGGQDVEGALGRLADDAPALRRLLDPRVVGRPGGDHQRGEVGVRGQLGDGAARGHAADGPVAGALDVVAALPGDDGAHRHLVLRQRARLVRADGRDRAQRLDGGHLPRDRVALGHLLHAERERDGDQRGEALGDGGDGEPDGGRDQLAPVHAVDEVAEAQHADGEDADQPGQLRAEPVQLARERGVELVLLRDERGDPADLGARARRDDHALRGPGGDDGAGEQHRGAVADPGVGGDGVHRLLRRHGLAGEGGLVGLEGRRGQQPEVGRDAVARAQPHDVARDEGAGVDDAPGPVAQRLGLVGLHGLEPREGGRRAALLDEADQRGRHDDDGDHREVDPVAGERLERGRRDEDVDQQVVEVREEPQPGGLRRGRRQLVPAALGQAPLGLRGGEPLGGGAEGRGDGFGGLGPGRGFGGSDGHGASLSVLLQGLACC